MPSVRFSHHNAVGYACAIEVRGRSGRSGSGRTGAPCYNPRALKRYLLQARFTSLVLLALLCLGDGRTAHATPPTLDAYKQVVGEAYAAAQRGDRIGLDERAEALLAMTAVLLPDGSSLPVDNRWLGAALAEEPPDYPQIVARLGAILDALGQTREPADPDALEKLSAVYEAPPFKARPLPSLWNRFWGAVGRAISSLFDRLLGSLPNLPAGAPNPARGFATLTPVGWVMLITGLLLVLGLVVYAVRGVRRSIVSEAQARAQDEEATLSSADAAGRAQADARTGEYRTAARFAYLAALLWLEECGLLRYDRSDTNREYLEQLRDKPVHDALAPIVETYERVWYGNQQLDDAGFTEYERQVTALREREDSAR